MSKDSVNLNRCKEAEKDGQLLVVVHLYMYLAAQQSTHVYVYYYCENNRAGFAKLSIDIIIIFNIMIHLHMLAVNSKNVCVL